MIWNMTSSITYTAFLYSIALKKTNTVWLKHWQRKFIIDHHLYDIILMFRKHWPGWALTLDRVETWEVFMFVHTCDFQNAHQSPLHELPPIDT